MSASDSFSLITNRSLWEQFQKKFDDIYVPDECFIMATFCTLALENKLRIKRSVVEPNYHRYTVQVYDNDNILIWENSYDYDIRFDTKYLNKKEGDYIQFPIAFENWTEFPDMPEFLGGQGLDFISPYESNMDICFCVKIRSDYVEDELATMFHQQNSVSFATSSSAASLSC